MRRTIALSILVCLAWPLAPTPAFAAGSWPWPLTGPIIRGYDPPNSPYGAGHRGIDIAAPFGTPVRAAGDGVVSWAGQNGEYGNHVAIDHGDGMVTTYSHLRGIAADLRAGERVRQGQVVGFVGQTGLATGPHLHFALFVNQLYMNPLTARVTLRRSVRNPARFQLARQTLLTQLVTVPLPPPTAPAEPITVAGLAPWHRLGVVTLTR